MYHQEIFFCYYYHEIAIKNFGATSQLSISKSSRRKRYFQPSNFSFAVTIAVTIAADCDWRKEKPGTFSQYKCRESEVCVCATKPLVSIRGQVDQRLTLRRRSTPVPATAMLLSTLQACAGSKSSQSGCLNWQSLQCTSTSRFQPEHTGSSIALGFCKPRFCRVGGIQPQ